MHGHGYLHNDIHPGNLVEVQGEYRLIDFDHAVQCSKIRRDAPPDYPTGQKTFASHHWGQTGGPGDDLEALCYTLACMHSPDKELWRVAARDVNVAADLKRSDKLLYLFEDLPKVFQQFFNYVYDLDINAVPHYEKWRQRFLKAAADISNFGNRKRSNESIIDSARNGANQCRDVKKLQQSRSPSPSAISTFC